MGCGVNGCLSGKGPTSQPMVIHGRPGLYPDAGNASDLAREDTVVDGVCLREANAGHYFSEGELFGVGTTKAVIKQLHYRLDKWWTMCTYRQNRSFPRAEDCEAGKNRSLYLVGDLREDEAELSLGQYAQREPDVFHRRLVKGPPPIYRWVAWKVALRVQAVRVAGLYTQLKLQKPGAKWLKTIQKDLDRTFPTHPLFSEPGFREKGQGALENILVAYSLYSPGLGYCQGMNFVVAFILILSGFREEDTFWAFVAMMKHKMPNDSIQVSGIEGLYADGFPLLKTLQSLFWSLVAKLMPVVKEHVDSIDVPEVLWLHKWFSTIFIYSLPISYCIRFWDYIIADGISGLLRLSTAILQHLKAELVTLDFSGCCDLFKALKEGYGLPPVDKLITAAERMSVDWTALEIVRQQVVRQLEEEAAEHERERLARLAQEEKKQTEEQPGTSRVMVKACANSEAEESKAKNDQGGKCAEDEAAKLPPTNKRRSATSFKRRHMKGRTSSKQLGKGEAEENFLRLPPIMNNEKKQFVFEGNNDVFCSDGGNVASADNEEAAAADSFRRAEESEGCTKRAPRRKSYNLWETRHSAKQKTAKRIQIGMKELVEKAKPGPRVEKIFAPSPRAALIIKDGKDAQTDREVVEVIKAEEVQDLVSHSLDDRQQRGGGFSSQIADRRFCAKFPWKPALFPLDSRNTHSCVSAAM